MEQIILEGTWEEILLHAAQLAGKRLRVTTVGDEYTGNIATRQEPQHKSGHLYFGMFQGDKDVTEEDFKIAECAVRISTSS